MDDNKTGQYWEENARGWAELSRMGLDIYRDLFNTPAFLSILPSVEGLKGLDIGCGEGYNTRKLAELGASMSAIDIAPTFIRYSTQSENENPLSISYQVASGTELPFPSATFDFATAFMSLMDMADNVKAISEAYRVIKPGGFFQFSICHPCFSTKYREWVDDENGKHVALAVAGYFDPEHGQIDEYLFSQTPPELRDKYPKFKVPRFDRTLSDWFNVLIDTGFTINRVLEPTASDEAIAAQPHLADTRIISHFLIVQCLKPDSSKFSNRGLTNG